jgi:hypothetical protein
MFWVLTNLNISAKEKDNKNKSIRARIYAGT